jgi:hypothetical protein
MSAREVAENVAAGYEVLYSEEVTFKTDGVARVVETTFLDAITNIFN